MTNRIFVILLVVLGCSPKPKEAHQQDFKTFLMDFNESEKFQLEHVSFPLKMIEIDIMDEETHYFISKEDWNQIILQTGTEKADSLNGYQGFIEEMEGVAVFIRTGIDNGIRIEYTFAKKDSDWFLVQIKDLST